MLCLLDDAIIFFLSSPLSRLHTESLAYKLCRQGTFTTLLSHHFGKNNEQNGPAAIILSSEIATAVKYLDFLSVIHKATF